MKKINELVTKTEKPEHKSKRRAVTFGSFKRAEEKQIQERKDREHQEELDRIAEDARIQRAISDEETRVIKEENTRKRNDTITKKLSNAFGTKTELDYQPVREQVIDKYLPQLREQETLDDHPKPFVAEPALNAELAEFKKKINEHLHKVGFASSSGGGAGSFADLDDVDPSTAKVNGKFLKYDSSSAKFVGADASGGSAADDISAGDSAINLTTTSGDITIDAAANNSDIILKGTDGSVDTTFLTIDGSSAGKATFNNEIVSGAVITSGAGLVIADAGNIGSASDTDAIAIAANGVVTFSQVPSFPNDTVETADIQADAITGAKIADDAINSEHYTDGSIDTAHIADANVTLAKIADAAANTVIVRDANSSGVLSAKAVTNTQILIGDGTGFTAAALSGDVTMTNAGAVTIANTSVTNGMLAGSIANAKLSNSSITVSDGSTTTAVSLGGTITFSGTSNEVTVGESSGTITVGLPNDVTIAGDLTINGDTTTVNTATLSVEDPLIILANGNNSADSVDIGFYGLYDTSGSQDLYAGLFRDANDSGKFKLFKDLQAAPTTTVNVSGTGYAVGTLVANIEGNVTGNTSGTAATVTTAAQSNITSLGTLTTLTVDNIIINGTNIGHTSDTDAIAISSGGVVNFTQAPTVSSAAIKTAGKETIYVPASAMYPTTSNGCAALAQVETTAQQPEFKVLDFDKDATEYAQFTVAFPKSWNASTITFRAFWIGVASTDGVAWALQGRSVADNAESVGAFGTAVVVQDDSQNDATETLISAESSDVTIAGVADDTLTYFQIYRDHDDANDDMAGDARLLGIQLFYTTDAANDA